MSAAGRWAQADSEFASRKRSDIHAQLPRHLSAASLAALEGGAASGDGRGMTRVAIARALSTLAAERYEASFLSDEPLGASDIALLLVESALDTAVSVRCPPAHSACPPLVATLTPLP